MGDELTAYLVLLPDAGEEALEHEFLCHQSSESLALREEEQSCEAEPIPILGCGFLEYRLS